MSHGKLKNYIAGRLVEPVGGEYIDNVDPATGEVYSYVSDGDERDVEHAVEAAEALRFFTEPKNVCIRFQP